MVHTPAAAVANTGVILCHHDAASIPASSIDVLPLEQRDSRSLWQRINPFTPHIEEQVLPTMTQVIQPYMHIPSVAIMRFRHFCNAVMFHYDMVMG